MNTSSYDLMLYGAAALRGVVVTPTGQKLCVSDLSNIEGRVLAYIAGEHWKLEAFRAYDRGVGPDLYNLTASGILGIDPYKITKKDRNVFGKVPDLALGYEGGVGALQTFAKTYNVRMADHWDVIRQNVRPDLIDNAYYGLEQWGLGQPEALGISELEWVASESVKNAWRDRHPATRALWRACKEAAINAIHNVDVVFQAGPHLRFHSTVHNGIKWLLVLLPSGRYLTYHDVRVHDGGSISYMGYGSENGGNRVWMRLFTYGGKIVENACQALAGDILKDRFKPIEAAGYRIVLSVHDEVVAQVPDHPAFNADRLSSILATPPVWIADIPLAAAGFEAKRYKKED